MRFYVASDKLYITYTKEAKMNNITPLIFTLALSAFGGSASAAVVRECGPLTEIGDPGACVTAPTAVPVPSPVVASWRLLGPAASHHFSQHGAPVRGYQENNMGIGIEYNRRDSATVSRYYAGLVKDSYDRSSIYVGGAYQWTIVDRDRLRIDAGAITMLWNRSVVGSDDIARKQVILAALPMVSIEDKNTGMGLNVSFVPEISYRGRQYTVNTVTVQLSVKI